jgi:hypothetical protein
VSPAGLIVWLGWACYAGALAAIVVYVIHFAGRQGWKRPWNAAGLFFTSIALSQIPPLFVGGYDRASMWRAITVTLCLLVATGLQAFTALRRRRRRADDAPAPETAAPEPPAEGPAA